MTRLHRSTLTLTLGLVLLLAACAGNAPPDTSQLSAQGLRDYKTVQVVRAINDVTTAAIAANKVGTLSDAFTAQVLTINKQVLDVIEANPIGFRAQALATIGQARDALPAATNAALAKYLQQVIDILQAVQ